MPWEHAMRNATKANSDTLLRRKPAHWDSARVRLNNRHRHVMIAPFRAMMPSTIDDTRPNL